MKKAPKRTGPSRMSLREMPEVDLKDGRWRPNPYAAGIAAEGITAPKRGRPKKGEETGPSLIRSVRFPARVWSSVESVAKARGVSVHAALRAAILEWLARADTSR